MALTNFVYTGKLRWLAAIQMCQHLFFFFTWNEHPYTKKVRPGANPVLHRRTVNCQPGLNVVAVVELVKGNAKPNHD